MNMIAAALLASFSLHAPALAQHVDVRAELRLTIVDESKAPVPNALVTIFTMHGPRTVNADEKGVVVLADLPAELTQVWARTAGELSGADASKLKPGENTQTVTLHAARPLAEVESGS